MTKQPNIIMKYVIIMLGILSMLNKLKANYYLISATRPRDNDRLNHPAIASQTMVNLFRIKLNFKRKASEWGYYGLVYIDGPDSVPI